jgi:TolA-binding protein
VTGLQRIRGASPLLLALLFLTTAAHAQEQPQVSQAPPSAAETAAAANGQQAHPVVGRIEALRTAINEDRDDVLAVEAQAREARGADLLALRAKGIEMQLDSMAKLRKLVDAVHELEAGAAMPASAGASLPSCFPPSRPGSERTPRNGARSSASHR